MENSSKVITELKLGRNFHEITKADRFLDNGLCVQLLKAKPMKVRYGEKDTMTLKQGDLEHLAKFGQITHGHHEYRGCKVFSLVHPEEKFYVMGYCNQVDIDSKEGRFLGAEGYYHNARKIKNENVNSFFAVKIFDSDMEEVNY